MGLELLDSEGIADIFFSVATPNAIRSVLQSNKDVLAAREYLRNCPDIKREILKFVGDRIVDLKANIKFPHEPAFCGLAVALETLPDPMALAFLVVQSFWNFAEMQLSSRVARICLIEWNNQQ